MNQDEYQSRFSRATSKSPVHREYPLRNSDKKTVYTFTESSDEEQEKVESPVRFYRSWSLDHQTNDSDPGYSSLNESKLNKTVGHSNPVPVQTDYQSESDTNNQLPVPKVLLKRSYSRENCANEENSISYFKRRRGRPKKQFIFSHRNDTSSRLKQLGFPQTRGRPFKRSRGRPRKSFESESINSFSTTSKTIHKVCANPEFFYGEEYNYVTDLAADSESDKLGKVHAPTEAKDNLQKQVQLKRRLSCDRGVLYEPVKEIHAVKQRPDKQQIDNNVKETVTSDTVANNKFIREPLRHLEKKPGCQFCAVNRQVDNFSVTGTSKTHRTINIDRCLNWAYQLSNTEWQDLSNSLLLLKSKYPVLKILFKRNPVIHLVDLKRKKPNELQRNSMASKRVLKDKKERKSNLVDPRVVPWSRSLIDNWNETTGIDKIFKKTKSKPFKQFTNLTSHSVAKSRHDVNFKQRLKEACKPKPKKMEKAGPSSEKSKAMSFHRKCINAVNVKKGNQGQSYNYSVKQTAVTSQANSDNRNSNCYNERKANIECPKQDRRRGLYPDASSQPCSSPGSPRSPIGSPGPPHLEKEFVRNMDDCYGDNEMEILKMNDFEIEICRDDIDESMPEVLDMRIRVKESSDTKRMNDSDQDIYRNSSLPHLIQEKPTGSSYSTKAYEGEEMTDSCNVPDVGSYISRYSHLTENLEVNVDEVSAADVNSYPSPSNLVIQNVCSLNQDYNKATDFSLNEPNIYNQRILEMLDGEIFDTNVADSKPLDLVKTTKQTHSSGDTEVLPKQTLAHYTSDSDETMVYSDASEEVLEFDNDSQTCGKSNEMSPRLKALKSTKNRISVFVEDSNNNDSDSSGSVDGDDDFLSEPSHNESQVIEYFEDKQDNEVFNDEIVSNTNETSYSIEKQYSKSAAEFALALDFKKKRNIGNNQDDISVQQPYNEDRPAGLQVWQSDNDVDVRHADSGLDLRNRNSSHENGHSDVDRDKDEYDIHTLVINETANETDDAQEADDADISERKTKQPKGGKSMSLVRNLGKKKEFRDFMNKEKERRRLLNKESRMPKPLVTQKSRKNSNEDPDDLPQILPPKRRQRAQKSQSMEDTGGGSKSATMERIMADFPKHNWLFNKYNTVSKDDGTNSSRNTQNQDVQSEAMSSTVTSAVMSSVSGSIAHSQPLVVRHKPAGHQIVMRNPPEFQAVTVAGGNSARSETKNSISSSDLLHTKDSCSSSGTVSQSFVRNPAISPGVTCPLSAPARFTSTFTPCTSVVSTWAPVKEYDPTLTSLTLDNSPKSFVPLNEIDDSDQTPSDRDTLSANGNAQNLCIVTEETAIASVKRLSLVCASTSMNKWSQMNDDGLSNLDNKTDLSNSYPGSSISAHIKVTQGQKNSDRRELILDRRPEERQLNAGSSQENAEKKSNQGPQSMAGNKPTNAQGQSGTKSGIVKYQLGALRPETIKAIKRGNPALVKSQGQKLGQAFEKSIYVNVDNQNIDSVKTSDKIQVVGDDTAKTSTENKRALNNTGNEMEENLALIDSESTVKFNDKNIAVNLPDDKENKNMNEDFDCSQSRKAGQEDHRESAIGIDSTLEKTGYPLTMTKTTPIPVVDNMQVDKSSGMRQPDTEVWTAEPVPELISCESNVCDTEDMMLPLDLCINRNVTENSFANYRKHHPPPVQLVLPQIQKPPSSEVVTMATDMAGVQEEVNEEVPKEDENEEGPLQVNEIENNEISSEDVNETTAVENRPEVEIHASVRTLNEVTDLQGKVSELQSTVPAATLVSAEEVCETQINGTAAKVSPSSAPLPAVQRFIRPVPVVSQYRPVIVHPVQQLNSSPRTIRAQMIQPIVTVQSVTRTTAGLRQSHRQSNPQFSANIIQQPQMLSHSQTFQPMPQIRHAQPLHSVNQAQSNFGNIQLVIPAGQLFVPLQSSNAASVMQTNAPPMLQAFRTNTSQARQNSKPRKSRKIFPKSNEIPTKKQKLNKQESELQTPSDSVSDNSRESNIKVGNTSAGISTSENKSIVKDETAYLSSENMISDTNKKSNRDCSLSEESEDIKRQDSSDELMDVDDDFLDEMEEYRKLKEERKRKEKEEMEMRKKLVEKMKLAKAKKHTALNPESKKQEKSEDLGILKSVSDFVSSSVDLKEKVKEEKSLCNEINEGINHFIGKESYKECPDEDRTVEVIAEWNVPMTNNATETSTDTNSDIASYDSVKEEKGDAENQFSSISDTEESGVVDVGLDLRINQQTSRSGKSVSPWKKNSDICNSDSINTSLSETESDTKAHNIANRPTSALPQSQNNSVSSITSPSQQDKMLANVSLPPDHDSHASSIGTSVPPMKDNSELSLNQVGGVKITSVSSVSGSVYDTRVSAGGSVNLIQSKNVITDIELEQRPYSPPILTPRPISWLQRMREAASSLEAETKHTVTTITTSACKLNKAPASIPVVTPHVLRRSASLGLLAESGTVHSLTSSQSPLSTNTAVPTTRLRKIYTVSPKPDDYKIDSASPKPDEYKVYTASPKTDEYKVYTSSPNPDEYEQYTASPKPDDVNKLMAYEDSSTGTTDTDVANDLATITSGTNRIDANYMTKTSTDKVDRKDSYPVTVNILRNSRSCDHMTRSKDMGNNESIGKVGRASSDRNVCRDMSRTNEIKETDNTSFEMSKTSDSSMLKHTETRVFTQEHGIMTNNNDTNNERFDVKGTDYRKRATTSCKSDEADMTVTLYGNKTRSNNIGIDSVSISRTYEMNEQNFEDNISAMDRNKVSVESTTECDTISVGVDMTTTNNGEDRSIDRTNISDVQAENSSSDKMDNTETYVANDDMIRTSSKEMAKIVNAETGNVNKVDTIMTNDSVTHTTTSKSSSFAMNISSCDVATVELDLSVKSSSSTSVASSLSSSGWFTSSDIVSSQYSSGCADKSVSITSKENDTVCSSSRSTTGVLMSVMMSVGVQPSDKNRRPKSASFAEGNNATDLSVGINSALTPKTENVDFPKSVSGSVSSFTTASGSLEAVDYTTAIDYSSKSLSTIKNDRNSTGLLPESLGNYKTLYVTQKRPCSDVSSSSSSHIYTTTSSTPVTVAYSGYSALSKAVRNRLSSANRMNYEIPMAHSTKTKPENVPKGAKPPLAHNNCCFTSLKSLIKKMNRTMCPVPCQIQQSCPYFKKLLQYNWSPSPKDTYRSKLARRETPVPPLAHNQKPFGIAGKLIIPSGRFIRKRSRSVELKGMPFGPSNAPSNKPGLQQLVSPANGKHYSSTSYPQMHNLSPTKGPILPPIRAHIHLEGTVDTVTLTNIQKPGTDLTGSPKLTPKNYSKKLDVVDLTREDKEVIHRDIQLDDAEIQIQQELSEAVAKRQKMESGMAETSMQRKGLEPGEIGNNAGSDPKSASYSQEWEDNAARKQKRRARSQSFSFQMNRPVLPTGAYYQPMQQHPGQGPQKVGPPNVTLTRNYIPALQEQPRPYLDVETSNLRSVLQVSSEDVQAHILQSQTPIDSRVPPLMKMRDGARMSQPYVYPSQQEAVAVRSPLGTGYPGQPRGMLRPQGSQAQQLPGLVNHYLVPARKALHSPRLPAQQMAGPVMMQRQLPRISPKQPYGGSGMTPPHGTGMIPPQGAGLSPRQRFPPPPYHQRNAQYGQMQTSDLRYDQGQISPQFPRVQAPSPDFQGYNTQGQRLHNQDARQLMPSPQQYQFKGQGQLPSPGVQVRYSPGQTVREYLHSPIKSQGQSSRPYMNMPQGHITGTAGMQEQQGVNIPANLATLDRYGTDVRVQGQGQGQMVRSPHQQMSPQVHPETSLQPWSHGGPGPQGQRQHYSLPQERITPPANPTYTAQHPTMHQYDKPYPAIPGRGASSYNSINQQTSVSVATVHGQGQRGLSQTNTEVGNQILQDQNHVRNQNVPYNTTYVNRNPISSQNNRSQNSGSQNIMYQETLVPGTQQQLPRQQPLAVPQYQGNQNIQNQRQVPARQNYVVSSSNSRHGESSRQHIHPVDEGQSSQYKQQLLSNQQMVTNNRNQFSNDSNHSNQSQFQQQQYGNNSYKQQESQHGQNLSSNQGHARNQMTVSVDPNLPSNQGHARNQMTVNVDPNMPSNHGHARNQMTVSVDPNLPSNQGHARNQMTVSVDPNLPSNQGHARNQMTVSVDPNLPSNQGHARNQITVNVDPNLPSNESHARNQITVNVDPQVLELSQPLPDNQGYQRNEMTLTSTRSQCQGDTVEVIEVEEDDFPHLQQVHSNCVLCGKFSLYLCSTCKEVWYCSPACQMSHWQTHSVDCHGDGT